MTTWLIRGLPGFGVSEDWGGGGGGGQSGKERQHHLTYIQEVEPPLGVPFLDHDPPAPRTLLLPCGNQSLEINSGDPLPLVWGVWRDMVVWPPPQRARGGRGGRENNRGPNFSHSFFCPVAPRLTSVRPGQEDSHDRIRRCSPPRRHRPPWIGNPSAPHPPPAPSVIAPPRCPMLHLSLGIGG